MTHQTFPTPYEQMANEVLTQGNVKTDRTGTGTISQFGKQARFDLKESFPLITSKRVSFNSMAVELLWFLRGDTNAAWLQKRNCKIWDEWALTEDKIETVEHELHTRASLYALQEKITTREAINKLDKAGSVAAGIELLNNSGIPTTFNRVVAKKGDLGPIYGKQWRSWEGTDGKVYDQIADAIALLKTSPDSRRILVSAWKVDELSQMALMPCHTMFQFYTRPIDEVTREKLLIDKLGGFDNYIRAIAGNTDRSFVEQLMTDNSVPAHYLSCQLYQRSADIFLGVPFNIASYALLTLMIAQQTNMVADEFIWTGGDCHIYSNHTEQVSEMLSRPAVTLPTLKINRVPKTINDYKLEDFDLIDYNPHPIIKAPVAV